MSAMSTGNRTYYDEFAKTYEQERHHGYHALIDELEIDLLSNHIVDRDVLEVGCGTGLILKALAERGGSATGVDLSAGMLSKATERGLRVAQGSATELPFADESFDVVCSFKVLAHVTEIKQAMREMARVTRPGGRLFLEFYNRRSLRYLAKRATGPQRIGEAATDEAAIPTRWDTRATIASFLPDDLTFDDTAGVRIFTPAAFVHRVPVMRNVFGWLERSGRDSALRNFGGFLVAILDKRA